MHAECDNLFTEEEVEQAADEGFDCTACQPYVIKPVVPVVLPEIISVKVKEPGKRGEERIVSPPQVVQLWSD
uniref:Uncharacterized protein n=1 Tax=Sphenodon punctatus TaxID=8508 RepID=A0A8D0LAK3_SPHPU